MSRLYGKIAVITGGANGLGQAFAKRLAEDGADIAVADVQNTEDTRALVEAAGRRFHAVPCDVTDPHAIADFAASVKAALGDAHILVNNVGIYPFKPFLEMHFEEWQQMMSINVNSMFLFSKAFVPGMVAQKFGRIVNLSSAVLGIATPSYVHYMTTKAAAIGFTRALANEFGDAGITVNAIAPSLVENDTTKVSHADVFDIVSQLQAIHRRSVPDDIVGTLSFLVSDDAAFVTGQTIAVDGGMTKS